MQENWGRRNAFVALEESQLVQMLQPVFPRKRLTSVELLTSGLCNTNYKIYVDGLDEAFVLRIYVRDQNACQRDRDILTLVKERVPVPELLYSHITSDPGESTYAVMRWVDGVLFSEVLATKDSQAIEECAYSAGRTLAAIGTYRFPQAGFFGPSLSIAEPINDWTTTSLAYIEQPLFKGRAGKRLGPTLTNRLWQFVNNNHYYFQTLNEFVSLAHADYKGFNILVDRRAGHWQVTCVLDWEFAFAGSPLCDIGNMLRYEHLHPPTFETQFMRGYCEHGGYLPEGWKKSAKLVDLLSLCEFLNMPDARDTMVEEVRGLIVGTMEGWERYL